MQTLDPKAGGVASAVLSLSGGVADRGHEVDIVTLDQESFPTAGRLRIHCLEPGLTGYHYSASLTSWLREHAFDFDCVIVHGLWQHVSFAVWRQFHGSATPYYVFPHGMLDPWFKRTFPLKHLKKWLYWPWAEYRVLRDAAAVVFTSQDERMQARESFWLYRCNERVSPLGIAVEETTPEAKEIFLTAYPQLRARRLLLFLGRLHPKKGCDLLLQALAGFPEFSLVMAGPDQIGWAAALRGQTDPAVADQVVFTGMLEGKLKVGALAAAEAFVLPSHQENFGMSVVEALAASLPVLISKRVNIWREIEQTGAGYVEDDDLAGTQKLIERWRAASPDQRQTMSVRARQCYEDNFRIDRAVDSLLSIIGLSGENAASRVSPVNAG